MISFTKQEAGFLLDTINKMPVQSSVEEVRKGLNLNPLVTNTINKLNKILMEETKEEVQEAEIVPATPEVPTETNA